MPVNVFSVDYFSTRRISSSARSRKHTTSCWRRWLDSILSRRHMKTIVAGCRSIAAEAAAATAMHRSMTGNSRHRSYSIDTTAFWPDLRTLGFVLFYFLGQRNLPNVILSTACCYHVSAQLTLSCSKYPLRRRIFYSYLAPNITFCRRQSNVRGQTELLWRNCMTSDQWRF